MNTTPRIALKALGLFLAVNLLLITVDPVPLLARASLYNGVLPGRQRLPWGERPDLAHNLSLNNLDAMFGSHELAQPKAADEFRVVLIGDSSTWGFLLRPEDTLAGRLNAAQLQRAGKRVRVYNVGYPDFSLTKDALLLQRALRHQPDLIVWLVTLRSFPRDAQAHALSQANPAEVCALRGETCAAPASGLFDRTVWGRRREIADLLRLQLLGVMWAASGIDQHYPAQYEPVQRDLDKDEAFRDFTPATGLPRGQLAFDAFDSAAKSGVPLIVVNEPMLISQGANSDVRYNFFYPRWAYDAYRSLLREDMTARGVRYLDLWDSVPQSEFTNSAVHLTPAGSQMLADRLGPELLR